MIVLIYVNIWPNFHSFRCIQEMKAILFFRSCSAIILNCFKKKMQMLSLWIFYLKLFFLSWFLKESSVVPAWCSSSPIWPGLSTWRVCKCGPWQTSCIERARWPASCVPVLFGDDEDFVDSYNLPLWLAWKWILGLVSVDPGRVLPGVWKYNMQRALEIEGSKQVPDQKQCFRDSQVERSMQAIREGFLEEVKCFKMKYWQVSQSGVFI